MTESERISVLEYKLRRSVYLVDTARWTHRSWEETIRQLETLCSTENEENILTAIKDAKTTVPAVGWLTSDHYVRGGSGGTGLP